MSSKNLFFLLISLVIHLCLASLLYVLTASKKNHHLLPNTVSLLELQTPQNPSLTTSSEPRVVKDKLVESMPANPWQPVNIFYIPVSQLDSKPIVIKDIDPNLLENFRGVKAQSLELNLLINEYGDVDRVILDSLIDTVDLPDRLLDDLKQRFLEARFLPGRLNNQPVPSQMRIRIRLE